MSKKKDLHKNERIPKKHQQRETQENAPKETERRQQLEQQVGGVDDGSNHFPDSETPKSETEKQQEKSYSTTSNTNDS